MSQEQKKSATIAVIISFIIILCCNFYIVECWLDAKRNSTLE